MTMTMTTDAERNVAAERDIEAAQMLLGLGRRCSEQEERGSLLDDAWALLERAPSHEDTWRLRGIVRQLQERNDEAIDLFYQARSSGDLSALIYLEVLLRHVGRDVEADEVAAVVAAEIAEGNANVLWSIAWVAMNNDFGLYQTAQSHLTSTADDMFRLAAEAGHLSASCHYANQSMRNGDPGALDKMRLLAQEYPRAAVILAQHLWPFGELLAWLDEEETEGEHWARRAHDQGDLQATVWLWYQTDPPLDAEYQAILAERFINDRRAPAVQSAVHRSMQGNSTFQLAESAESADELVTALRLQQVSATFGYDEAVSQIGTLLVDEAGTRGPWATLGVFMEQWPGNLERELVGSPFFPLGVMEQAPALRDDHSAALAIDDSDFARRIKEVLEQVPWKMSQLGDHLLAGRWSVESGNCQIFIEISGGEDQDRYAKVSTPLLVGLPDAVSPAWVIATAETPRFKDQVDSADYETYLSPEYRQATTDIAAFTDSHQHIQRRVIEALLRLGENDSREHHLTGMGRFGMTLGGMMGRRMTFRDTPERLYPQAWASTSLSDYCSSSAIMDHPEAHRCSAPIRTLNIGYTLSADLSGGHLKSVLIGTVSSLMAAQDYVTKMFDDEPGIFEEFFHAVPMARIFNHRELFNGAVPDLEVRLLSNIPSKIRGDLLQQNSAPEDRAAPRPPGAPTLPSAPRAPGQIPLARPLQKLIQDPDADEIELNNAAFVCLQDGHPYEAMAGFDRAASKGVPNALASLIWTRTLLGLMEDAIAAFENYFPRVSIWMDSITPDQREDFLPQLPNCKSNAGLAYLALGNRAEALRLWSEAGADGHPEAKLYPAVLAARDGDHKRAKKLLKRLSPSEIVDIQQDMEEVFSEGTSWFREWAGDALKLLASE